MLDITGLFVPKKVQLVSLGCSKNRVDSEKLLADLSGGGLEILPEDAEYEVSRPDVVIINTCGFIETAKQESINEILKAVEAKKNGFVSKVVVCGCLSERYRGELDALIPEADAFFGSFQWKEIVEWLGIKVTAGGSCAARYITTPKHYAYLKISEGCNRRCSYCAIPLIKGSHKSVPEEELLKEAESLAANGVRELILIAQDTTYYGMDIYGKRTLGRLIRKLCGIDGIEWIRIHYSYPLAFPKDVLRIMATEPKVCKYLDIPLQHSSDKVLKMMRRGIDGEGTQKIIDRIRAEVPGVALRTTLIVGHPGEGAAEFQDLMRFVRRNRFEMLGAFTYSCEENTYAAVNYKDSVPERTKRSRYDRLMKLQAGISLENNMRRVGTVEKVLIDDFRDGMLYGRSQWESPEVDGQIVIGLPEAGEGAARGFVPADFIGKFAAVRITGASEYDLVGELA